MTIDHDRPDLTSGEFAKALAAAQSQMQAALKDSTNPHFKSKYADLNSVRAAVLPPLNGNGFAVLQFVDLTPHGPALVTMLLHATGGRVSSRYPLNPTKGDPQAFGAALSYAKRYALQSLICCAAEDDDAESAMPPRPQARAARSPADRRPDGNHPPVAPKPSPPAAGTPVDFAVARVRDLLVECYGYRESSDAHAADTRLKLLTHLGVPDMDPSQLTQTNLNRLGGLCLKIVKKYGAPAPKGSTS